MSFEIIIPFLRPIQILLESETVSEIMVNPDSSVWVEEFGQIRFLPNIHFDEGALQTGLDVIANRFGKKLDADSPILNLRLPDGSRMAAMIPPIVNPRPLMTVRRFTAKNFTLADLIETGMLTNEQASILTAAVRDGKNILIAGQPQPARRPWRTCWPMRSLSRSASLSSKTPRNCASVSPMWSPRSRNWTPTAARSHLMIC